MIADKRYEQNGMDKMLCGQNGIGQNVSGQNGTDKMVRITCYADKMLADKMVWTKWYGQIGLGWSWQFNLNLL